MLDVKRRLAPHMKLSDPHQIELNLCGRSFLDDENVTDVKKLTDAVLPILGGDAISAVEIEPLASDSDNSRTSEGSPLSSDDDSK